MVRTLIVQLGPVPTNGAEDIEAIHRAAKHPTVSRAGCPGVFTVQDAAYSLLSLQECGLLMQFMALEAVSGIS